MEEIDYREKDWIQAQSYRVGTGPGYYPANSYQAPTKQPLKILSKLVNLFKSYDPISSKFWNFFILKWNKSVFCHTGL